MLRANGLLSHLISQGCSTTNLFLEMDRILQPEGWVVVNDKVGPIEKARSLAMRIHWEARVIDLQNGSDQRLLVCQKPFLRKYLIQLLVISTFNCNFLTSGLA